MKYLERYIKVNCDPRRILNDNDATAISVVIPAYKESLTTILQTLNSLDKSAQLTLDKYLVLLLINYRDSDEEKIKDASIKLYKSLSLIKFDNIYFKPSVLELKGKRAGVGMARKVLMDNIFWSLYSQNIKGLIVNLDADTTVNENYFKAIKKHFETNEKHEATSIAFAHYLNGENVDAIIAYELHLRYFVNMQRKLCLPFAYQTVGSAMVVQSDAYAKEGGMVRRQAGEDFYFLHKYSKNVSLGEINDTVVMPSDRGSDRVPFGTGKAVNDMQLDGVENYQTYNPKSFEILDNWLLYLFSKLKQNFEYSESFLTHKNDVLIKFLKSVDAPKNLKDCIVNVSGFDFFLKRFYNWFDAFMLMKYLHFMRDECFENINIEKAINYLFTNLKLENLEDRKLNLLKLREYDMKSQYYNQWRADLITKLFKTTAS